MRITPDVWGDPFSWPHVDPKTVQYLAGHENSKVTMDIVHLVKDMAGGEQSLRWVKIGVKNPDLTVKASKIKG